MSNHIPIGLYQDLIDVGEELFSIGGALVSACNGDGSGCTIINDEVFGFTNSKCLRQLGSSTDNVAEFQACLINNHLSSTTNS